MKEICECAIYLHVFPRPDSANLAGILYTYVSLLINTVGVPKGLMMITRVWIFSPLHCFSPLNFSNCVLEIVSSSLPWGFQGQRQGACAVVRKMDRILSAYTEEDGLDDAKGEFFPFFASR